MTAPSGSASALVAPGSDVGQERGKSAGHRRPAWEPLGLVLAVVILCAQVMPELWQRSLWLDEAYTVGAIQNLQVTLTTTPGQMPLYYLGMHLWGTVTLAAWWLRLPSLAASIGVLILTRSLARRTGGPECAAVAPVLLAVSPMFVTKAIEARPYGVVVLLVVVCWYCYSRDHEASAHADGSARRRWLWILTVAATVGPAFHALFFLQFAAIIVVAAITRTGLRRLVPPSLGCAACTLLVAWMASGVRIGELNSLPIGVGLAESYLSGRSVTAVMLLAVVTLGIVVSVARFRIDRRVAMIAPTVWVSVPVVLALLVRRVKWIYGPRYVAAIAPALAILAGVGIVAIARAVLARNDGQRSFAISLTLAAVLCLAAVDGPRPTSEWVEDWNGAARMVASYGRDGDCIGFAYKPDSVHQWFRAPFEVAWNRLDDPPAMRPISPARPFGSVRNQEPLPSTEQLFGLVQNCDRLWLITYHDSLGRDTRLANELATQFVRTHRHDFQGEIRVMVFRAVSS